MQIPDDRIDQTRRRPIPVKLGRALEDFQSRPDRDPQRQIEVQRWCVNQLRLKGVEGALTEVQLPGAYRAKNWDVALVSGGEPQLAISCKSIVRNIPGTVPNRLDDMLGEAVNLHREFPKAVIGYLILLGATDGRDDKNMDHWFDRCGARLGLCGPRQSADQHAEKWEALCLLQRPLGHEMSWMKSHPACDQLPGFFSRLAAQHQLRFGA